VHNFDRIKEGGQSVKGSLEGKKEEKSRFRLPRRPTPLVCGKGKKAALVKKTSMLTRKKKGGGILIARKERRVAPAI